ncbi:MAG TPA: M67 family metallopeptidase [Acidimicrobiia bacterium]
MDSQHATQLASPTLHLTHAQYEAIVAHCFDGFPDEACGLLAGPLTGSGAGTDPTGAEPTGEVTAVYPCENAAHSARVYRISGKDLMSATLDASKRGDEIVSVWHSHTHTDAYPSPTDVDQAMEAQRLERPWLYAIVSLKYGEPVLRAYWIRERRIIEVAVEVGHP